MKPFLLMCLMALSLTTTCLGQTGTDVSTAIPIYFGQTINDNLDAQTRPRQVYSISLGKGQKLSVTAPNNIDAQLFLYSPGATTIFGTQTLTSSNIGQAPTFTYQVAASGVYYIQMYTSKTGLTYSLQALAIGPIVPVGSCTPATTLAGPVNYITYSLDLIAAGLPDAASIGGTVLCSTCAMKPPAYPALVTKLEKSMGLNLNVSAGFDSSGNMCQLKLMHP